MILIRVPYNLRTSDEVRIYQKLLGESGAGDVHIAPHALKVASIFAVLTRLEPSRKSGMSLMKKLKLYNQETVEGYTAKDVKELQEEAAREGMVGISPVFTVNLQPIPCLAHDPAVPLRISFCTMWGKLVAGDGPRSPGGRGSPVQQQTKQPAGRPSGLCMCEHAIVVVYLCASRSDSTVPFDTSARHYLVK